MFLDGGDGLWQRPCSCLAALLRSRTHPSLLFRMASSENPSGGLHQNYAHQHFLSMGVGAFWWGDCSVA
eukprot:5665304-Prorocentrum_lima.AAC.1